MYRGQTETNSFNSFSLSLCLWGFGINLRHLQGGELKSDISVMLVYLSSQFNVKNVPTAQTHRVLPVLMISLSYFFLSLSKSPYDSRVTFKKKIVVVVV